MLGAFHESRGNRKSDHRTYSEHRRARAYSNSVRSLARPSLKVTSTYRCFIIEQQPSGIVLAEASPQQDRTAGCQLSVVREGELSNLSSDMPAEMPGDGFVGELSRRSDQASEVMSDESKVMSDDDESKNSSSLITPRSSLRALLAIGNSIERKENHHVCPTQERLSGQARR